MKNEINVLEIGLQETNVLIDQYNRHRQAYRTFRKKIREMGSDRYDYLSRSARFNTFPLISKYKHYVKEACYHRKLKQLIGMILKRRGVKL